MTSDQVGILVQVAIALATIAAIYFMRTDKHNDDIVKIKLDICAQGERIARNSQDLETIRDFLWRRAGSEAVSSGMGNMNSPFMVNPDKMKCLDPVIEDMHTWYGSVEQSWPTDADLMLEIERKFGSRLFAEVCVPNQFTHGECLLMAVAAVKGVNAVNIP